MATGNVRGIVGVTFTTSHCKKNVDFPLRTNYNLRGHRSEVGYKDVFYFENYYLGIVILIYKVRVVKFFLLNKIIKLFYCLLKYSKNICILLSLIIIVSNNQLLIYIVFKSYTFS